MHQAPEGDVDRRRRERAERASALRAAHDLRRGQESDQARLLVRSFVAEAERLGLPTERLTARPWRGRRRYPTDVVGWYLRRDRSLGVGADAGYYVLNVPPRLLGSWRTTVVESSPPPLLVGEGARDGESIELERLLRLRLGWS